nr:hypothetical protein Iba_chr03bCG15430 [Ipomoea batatas]
MSRGRVRKKIGREEAEDDEDESDFSNCKELTANGMFSWSGLHLESCGGCALYIMARRTAETVGMYAVLFRASSHSSEALRATGIRSVAAIPLEICECGGRGGVAGSGEVERGGAGEGSDLVEADAAEAQNGVARGVGLGEVNVAALQRGLERVDALLIVVRDHRQVRARRRSRGGDLKRRPRVSREQPRGQHRTAPAPETPEQYSDWNYHRDPKAAPAEKANQQKSHRRNTT